MATDDAMDVESATQGLYMDVEHQSHLPSPSVPNPISSPGSSQPVDSSSRQVSPESVPSSEDAESILVARQVVVSFMRDRKARDIVPAHSRVVIVDANIRLKSAFRALLENGKPVTDEMNPPNEFGDLDTEKGVRAAPVIDIARDEFCGMLSVSDIVHSLLHLYYSHPVEDVHYDLSRSLNEYTVGTWQQQKRQQQTREGVTPGPAFRYADGDDSLFNAVRLMRDAHVLHLPILAQGRTLLHTLEHWRVLRFVHRHFAGPMNSIAPTGSVSDPQHATRLFSLTISQLGLGTYSNLITIPASMSLLRCLQTLQQHELAALPVIDNRNRLVEVYSRADAALLASGHCDGVSLQRPVTEVLRDVRGGIPFSGATCRRGDMLGSVFERFERTGVQRLYILGENGLEGVVSLSDLLRCFLYGY